MSVRCRLTFFAVMAMVPLLAVIFYTDLRYRNQEEIEARRDVETTARLVAVNVEKSVEGARQILVAISQALELNGQRRDVCGAYVARLTRAFPEYANVLVARPGGDILCSGLPFRRDVRIVDRSYFRRALTSGRFSMGEFQVGRISGKPSINFSYPLRNKAGDIKGIAVVAVDLAWLNKSLEGISLPRGSTVAVVDGNGTYLAHYPGASKWVGRSLKEEHPGAKLTGQGSEFVFEEAGKGRNACYLAFAPVHAAGGKLFMVASISKAEVVAGPNRVLRINMIVLAAILVLGLAVSVTYGRFFLVEPLNRLMVATRRIGEGYLGARIGPPYSPGEFGLLGKTFDDMAISLEKHITESAQVADSLRESEAMLRSFFDSPGVMRGIVEIVGGQMLFISGNDAAAEFFGYTKDSFHNKTAAELGLAQGLVSRFLERYEESRQTGKAVSLDFSHGEGTGQKLLSAMVSYMGLSPDGTPRFGYVAHDVTQRTRDEARIEQQLRRLAALRDIDMAITSSFDMRVMMRVIIDEVIGQLHVDAADILLINAHEMTLEYVMGRGFRTDALKYSRLQMGEGHAGLAALERKTIHMPELTLTGDSLGRSRDLPEEEFVDYIAVPLISKGHVKGVLEIFNRTRLDADREWYDFLEALATQSAIAIDNAEMYNDLERSHAELVMAYNTTLEGWSKALDYRDRETEGHSKRVTDITVATAKAMGMSDAELVHVRRGALLHDIGKLGVPDTILLKPGKLTEDEWGIMKQHPVTAHKLLSPITFLKEAIDIPYCHHEKWDGTGYPRGLKGEQIPMAARIFALVDVWDALKSDRPYRPAWQNDRVLEYIRSNAGVHFDPDIVPIFLGIVERI